MESSGVRGGALKTGIINPGRKALVESDAYWVTKFRYNICINDDEAKKVMGHTRKRTWIEMFCIKIIVDDVLMYGSTAEHILDYSRTVLNVLKHHCATLKLKKYKWFQDRCKFVGMYVSEGGTQHAQSKNETFSKLEQPNTWGDLCMLIGIFGFYIQFLPLYEVDIRPWR